MKLNKEIVVQMYFDKRLKPSDIAKYFNVDRSTITRILQKDQRYVDIKQERKTKNQQRHIRETKEYIKQKRKNIQLKAREEELILKNMHREASQELSTSKRLSNLQYRNWNKSAFTYNSKMKRYEFKEKLGRSFDVPKYIKVEV